MMSENISINELSLDSPSKNSLPNGPKASSCEKTQGIYTSEKSGCDEIGDGSFGKPFKTVMQAMRKNGMEPFPNIYVDAKEVDEATISSGIEEAALNLLNSHLSHFSYIDGHTPSSADLHSIDRLKGGNCNIDYPYLGRWLQHIVTLKNLGFHFPECSGKQAILCDIFPQKYELIAKSQLKKVTKLWKEECRKMEARLAKEKEDAANRAKALEEARKIVISLDSSLPKPISIKINDVSKYKDQRVIISGWCDKIRRGKCRMFVEVRDGSIDALQCILEDKLSQTYEAMILNTESTVVMYGTIKDPTPGNEAPGRHGLELGVDYWQLLGESPAGGLGAEINRESHPDIQLNKRHLLIREDEMRKVFSLLSILKKAFIDHYTDRGYKWVTMPTLVQTQCEGGSTLFDLNFFGEKSYLTQSSQLYLETCLPSLGDVFCIEPSYRAEQSRTRRHLAAYTHIEAECAFITFDQLLDRIEDLVTDVVDRVMKDKEGSYLVKELNPNFVAPTRNFRRMTYSEAIDFLKDNNITKDDGTFYEFGEDIPEAPERRMTDTINQPILLNRFPAEVKAFYMQKCEDDRRVTESVDLLMPGVGEIVGGSMRMYNLEELLEAYKRENLDPLPYYWYTDQRRYGTCPHGGYGLGLERFLCWLANRWHIRDAVLYPRFVGRCTP